MLALPIGPNKSSRLLKISCIVYVFLSPLNLGFHATTCLSPLVHNLFGFLISSFFLELPVLVLKPDLFHLLLVNVASRVVVEVAGAPFKSILRFKLHWVARSVKLVERMRANSFLLLTKSHIFTLLRVVKSVCLRSFRLLCRCFVVD